MVKKEDLLKIFFIYLCLCHVAPGHPCGNNPLRRFRPLSRMLGKDVNTLLNLLKDSNPTLYRQVQAEWRLYADCVGLVDTGYFKRSDPGFFLGNRPDDKGSVDNDEDQDTAVDMRFRKMEIRRKILYNLLNARTIIDAAAAEGDVREEGDVRRDTSVL
ncbi:hypothetical protein BaRGS_00031347, partial [Batillaria attramentaria]